METQPSENRRSSVAFSSKSINNLSLTARRREYIFSHNIENFKVYEIFQRAKMKIKCVQFFTSIIKDIKDYGTGSSLFDGTKNYKETLPVIMIKKIIEKKEPEVVQVKIEKKSVILPHFLVYKIWNMILSFALIYTCSVMPWLMAFRETRGTKWESIEIFIDCIYICDILITANLAYTDKEGILVHSRKSIIKNYTKGLLFIDILAIIPYHYLSNLPKFNSFFKLLRLGRLSILLNLIKLDTLISFISGGREKVILSVNRLFSGIGFLILLVHFSSCIWNMLPKINEYSPSSWIVRKENIDDNDWELYLTGCYFSITTIMTVGFGDYSAISKSEKIMCICLELTGICFYSFILSVMTSLLTTLAQKENFINTKAQVGQVLSEDLELPFKTKSQISKEIRRFYKHNVLEDSQIQTIWQRLPKKLRYELFPLMYSGKLSKVFFLQKQEKFVRSSIIPRLQFLMVKEKNVIFSEGDYPSNIYFLLTGRVSFVFSERNIVFKTMLPGSYFGEIGLLNHKYREFGALTCVKSELLVMSNQLIRDMVEQFPHVYEQMRVTAAGRDESNKRDTKDIIDVLDICEITKMKTLDELAGIRVSDEELKLPKVVKYPSGWVKFEKNLELQSKVYIHELIVIFNQLIKKRLDHLNGMIHKICKIIR
jgi:CRP-like cAMP-binding protein